MLAAEEIGRVLLVMAHPDDVDFSSAGTVAAWRRDGVEVGYCIVTDGDAGGFDPAVPRTEIPAIRRAEQLAAAAEVGVSDVAFLGYPDGRLTVTQDLRRDISRQIRLFRPDVVVTQSPQRNWSAIYASHPDHMAAGEATLCAVYPDSRNPFAHPELLAEGLEAWTVREAWVVADERSDHVSDITEVFDRKLAALLAHHSQHPQRDDVEATLREWNSANARLGGLPEGRLAETFRRVATA